jgi:hypothetical protein
MRSYRITNPALGFLLAIAFILGYGGSSILESVKTEEAARPKCEANLEYDLEQSPVDSTLYCIAKYTRKKNCSLITRYWDGDWEANKHQAYFATKEQQIVRLYKRYNTIYEETP